MSEHYEFRIIHALGFDNLEELAPKLGVVTEPTPSDMLKRLQDVLQPGEGIALPPLRSTETFWRDR